jgi:predicted transcriptional regulator
MGRRAEDRFDIVRCIDDRYDIIDLLRSGRHDKPSIVDALGTSRSTVDRAMARLEDHHLVRRRDTGYDLTYQGRGLLAWYDSSLVMLGPIGEHGAVLSELPSDLGLPIESLGSMEFHEADRYEPGLPQRRFLELLEESDRFRGIAPATNEQLIDTLHRRVAIEGRHAEVVTERPPLDADGETVVCRHCGAENRAGYQYCRWCVRSGFVEDEAGVTPGTAMTDRSL